jgi:hypothetical protein
VPTARSSRSASRPTANRDAVELKLKSGEIRRIGTDDPNGLVAALNAGLRR